MKLLAMPNLLFTAAAALVLAVGVVHSQHQPYYDDYADYRDDAAAADAGDGSYYYEQAGDASNMYTDYVENKAAGGYVQINETGVVEHSCIFSHMQSYVYSSPRHSAAGLGWGKVSALSAFSWFLGGKIHSKRAVQKANKLHKKQEQELYVQYYKDVLALQTQNAELQQYLDLVQKERIDADFEMADLDNDNRVSRAEFNAYKKRYLEKHPEMASQFPAFEQFDPDHNGVVTKAEHDAYYAKGGGQ